LSVYIEAFAWDLLRYWRARRLEVGFRYILCA
jgi:hypothetical protein